MVFGIKVRGPLGAYGEGFVEFLSGRGYARTSIEVRVRLLAHLSRWLLAEALDPWDCDAAILQRFLVARQGDHQALSSARALALVVTYLRSAGVVPEQGAASEPAAGSVDELLERWEVFLAVERGIKASTIRYYRSLARPFLVSRVRSSVIDFRGLDGLVVAAFARDTIPQMPVGSAKLTVTALRSLLRFLFLEGFTTTDLAPVVPARAGYRDTGLPRGLSPVDVTALLAATESESAVGRRDRAVVLLLVRLGLRASEVAGMCLDDLDWRSGTLRIAGKGGRMDVMPMPAEVGAALSGHLQSERHPVMAGRAVFCGSIAPYQPLTAGTVKAIVNRVGQRAGLGQVGAHRLRHSVATATVNAGASLAEVGQLLRHRSLSSTTIYAKVDLNRLATLTRPWPHAVAGQEPRS